MSIPGLDAWLDSAQGRYVLAWEQQALDALVEDIFGFNALQIGLPQCPFLRASRIPLRQTVNSDLSLTAADVLCDLTALPFASHSADLALLPHVLEFASDPHQILREVERILIPEGQIIIVGFNPFSLWGLQRRVRRRDQFPWNGAWLSLNRLKDWLRLLGFEVGGTTLGCYAPPLTEENWLRRWHPIENQGRRWWRFSGGVYILRAIKRTWGMRLITPEWRKQRVSSKALRPAVQKEIHEQH
ncbi:MAG: class I SAM-dependent methyltransferase [Azonexus sp.]|jgi:SAM-dependent methyltransferase|nr:class I SAM-dependent methyltransferase [Azonexus sp.]